MIIFVPMKHTTVFSKTIDRGTGEITVMEKNIVSRNNIFFISINSESYSKWLKKVKSIDHLLIAIYVAYNHDKNEHCFSTSINKYHVEKLAKIVNKSDRTVYRMINELIKNNIIKRHGSQLFANPTFFIKSTNTKNIVSMIDYYNRLNCDLNVPLSKEF